MKKRYWVSQYMLEEEGRNYIKDMNLDHRQVKANKYVDIIKLAIEHNYKYIYCERKMILENPWYERMQS